MAAISMNHLIAIIAAVSIVAGPLVPAAVVTLSDAPPMYADAPRPNGDHGHPKLTPKPPKKPVIADPEDWGAPSNSVEANPARTQNSKRFDSPDGTHTTIIKGDIHYQSGDDWYDTDLNFAEDGSDYVMETHPKFKTRVSGTNFDFRNAADDKGIRWYLPASLSVASTTASFSNGGLTWIYTNTARGAKLEVTVPSSLGNNIYQWTYGLLGGASALATDGSGNITSGTAFIIPRATALGADGVTYQAGDWEVVDGSHVRFAWNDTVLPPEAFPYVLDPTTLQPGAAGLDTFMDDGHLTTNYGNANNMEIGDSNAAGNRKSRGLIEFDLTSIDSGDVVSDAELDLYVEVSQHSSGARDFNLRRMLYQWTEGDGTAGSGADWEDYDDANTDWVGSSGAGTSGTDYSATLTDSASLDDTDDAVLLSAIGEQFDSAQLIADVQDMVTTSATNYGWRLDCVDCEDAGAATDQSHFSSSDNGTEAQRPKLTVTHTTPSAAITGTAGDGTTEVLVRGGSQTIIITLTAVTWVAEGAPFNAIRQDIIDGLDSAQSETYGWNAEIRDKEVVGAVVRTSSTVVTITLTANNSYAVGANETITVTVPASAHSGSGAITATPTFTVTAATESAAVTGTLSDNGTPTEIRAGGETIIITLTGANWVSTADFSGPGVREAILAGISSDQADANGWNNRRLYSDFAVSGVVRTNATTVTITLTASSAYHTPVTETLTVTVPASALQYDFAITASPTFQIVPTFASSGTWTSPAIDPSGVTDVAYCSLGWDAETPTGTTVTVTTSINGGTTYSSHTNGDCPTGISEGSTLVLITDMRIRVTLATTDTSVTPSIRSLGLVIEDNSGQDLYYQLNTVPGATLTDRSSNDNTGSHWWPLATSGLSASVGSMTSEEEEAETFATGQDVTAPVTGNAIDPGLFYGDGKTYGTGENNPGAGLPFGGVVDVISEAGEGLPVKFVWALFITVVVVLAGLLAMKATHGNVVMSGAFMLFVLGIMAALGQGLTELWTIWPALAGMAALLLTRRGLET